MAKTKRACPYLGLHNDRDTCISYPSLGNSCYRTNKPTRVLLEYQESCCLADSYTECPVYKSGGKVSLQKENQEPDFVLRSKLQNAVVAAILILILLGTAWMGYQYRRTIQSFVRSIEPATQPANTYVAPTFIVGSAQAEVYQPMALSTAPAAEKTSTPVVEAAQVEITPTVEGPENGSGFIVHKVARGESLDGLADKYYTSVEAILDINYKLTPPLPAERTIVIPEGIVKTGSYPQFEVRYVPEKTKVSFIIEKFECDPALFQQYNRSIIITSLDIEYILDKQWVLIPRERAKKKSP